MNLERIFTVKITGMLDRYDIKELERQLQEYMCDEDITLEIIKEEIK